MGKGENLFCPSFFCSTIKKGSKNKQKYQSSQLPGDLFEKLWTKKQQKKTTSKGSPKTNGKRSVRSR
ncbi:MAG: hypothetical protein D3923_04680 [Candidatus Electrothrix sp. AR3]|nr:hypothetical protein [Candidatus Electrothrix sp. AR3]